MIKNLYLLYIVLDILSCLLSYSLLNVLKSELSLNNKYLKKYEALKCVLTKVILFFDPIYLVIFCETYYFAVCWANG